MRARQRKPSARVVKRAAAPVGRGMALIAGLRKARLDVIGIGGALEVCQVTLSACPARQLVIIVRVALRALQRCMGARQSESGRRVIKSRRRPGRRVVALRASLREPGCGVGRIVGRVEVVLVAIDAGGIGRREIVVAVYVALHALQ